MATAPEAVIDATLRLAVASRRDPLKWAERAFDWGHGDLAKHTGPRAWQRDVMADIRDHLSNPETRFQPLMLAIASGHGIGKSALIGMVSNWAMSTGEMCRVVITANTETQLRTKTGPEVAKWFQRSISSWMFDVQATTIKETSPASGDGWRLDFATWSKTNTEAFAGLHNVGKRIVIIMDEGSAIEDVVWEVTEGALTDEDTEIIWLVCGNPTRNSGRFRECFRRYRHRWIHKHIDARDVEGTNKKLHAQWAADYGEDSDFFKVRVRGQFPEAGAMQFINGADVDAAFGRHLRPEQYSFAPTIIGVDPAWTGDDELVIMLRQGLHSEVLATMPKNDNDVQVAALIARFETERKADAVFVDLGWGTGIVSAGKAMGRTWQLVSFAGKPTDIGYLNKRAEMWGGIRQWLKEGGAIPPDETLRQDLIGPEILARIDGRIALESKEDMRQRGIPSPNRADALALTFAYPVAKRGLSLAREADLVQTEYDVLS